MDDGAGGLLTNQTVTVDITPKNDDPSAGGSIVLIEGETGVGLVGGSVPVIGGPRGDLIITDPDDFSTVRETLEKEGVVMAEAEVTMIPQNYVELTDETAVKNLQRTLDLLEDDDDVQAVYHNWDE